MNNLVLKLYKCWSMLRRLSGDDAYERYLEHWHRNHAGTAVPLDRAAFLRRETERRWNGTRRCC